MRIWAGFRAFTSSPSASVSDSAEDRLIHRALRSAMCATVLLLGGVMPLCAQSFGEIPKSFPDRHLDQVVVARVGPWNITGAEFQMGYDFGPAFVKREKDSKRIYLKYLINEKLLALDAQRQGLDQWPDVKRQVAEIQGDLATEELYKRDVLSKVHISNPEMAVGVKEARVHLSVRWLYCRTAPEVDSLTERMKSGVPFDTLFEEQLRAGAKRDNRSMDLTRFKLRMQNLLFAGIVDTMKANEVSLPIHGSDGWYVVEIKDAWIDPIVTQSDETKLESDVREALTQRFADSLSDAYVQRLITAEHPTIIRPPFNAIEAYLASKWLSNDTVRQWGLNERVGARDLKDVTNLEAIAGETLVTLHSKGLAVNDFLEWYRMRDPYIKLELATQEVFFNSVEGLVWRMVRDRLLTRRAYARGLQNLTKVKQQTRWWKEKMLYVAEKNRIAETITDSLPLVRKYYEENSRSFVDEKGKVKSFDAVQDDAWHQYYSPELTKRLLHEIVRLKQQYNVKIDEKALGQISVDDENDPKAVDVYTVKTRGIYPRTAFPSIDYYWQTWE